MTEKIKHSINENSVFFQGHKKQYFSRKNTSFKITQNRGYQIDGSEGVNYKKYQPLFVNEINNKIGIRNQGGGKLEHVSPGELKIKKIKLIDDENDEGYCGNFRLYPPTAICKENNCNTFFVLGEGRRCKHDDDAKSEQLTFLAVCDVCGWTLPIHYMTNIGYDCKECNSSNSLNKLIWDRKDDMSTYKVKCTKCGNVENLYFFYCNHDEGKRSDKESEQFKGVPARSNAIIHPSVLTTPYIPEKNDDESVESISFSKSFQKFFSFKIDEALLTLPQFLNKLNEEFWNLDEIKNYIKYQPGLDLKYINEWNNTQKLEIIKSLIKTADDRLNPNGNNLELIEKSFGIDLLRNAIEKVQNINFSQHDRQGILLSQIGEELGDKNYFYKPKSMNKDMWNDFLDEYNIKEIKMFQNLSMIQALLGTITGSGRKRHPLFRPIKTGRKNNKKPTVYVRSFNTEGLFIRLKSIAVAKWLKNNGYSFVYTSDNVDGNLRDFIMNNKKVKDEVFTLLHTISHMMIQESTITTGLDVRSLSEDIFPLSLGIFIYSTNTINIGGLESTYHNNIEDWLRRAIDLSKDCPQDPACMVHEGGACNACSYLPEFVCTNFNKNIDRSTIIGGERYKNGFIK